MTGIYTINVNHFESDSGHPLTGGHPCCGVLDAFGLLKIIVDGENILNSLYHDIMPKLGKFIIFKN